LIEPLGLLALSLSLSSGGSKSDSLWDYTSSLVDFRYTIFYFPRGREISAQVCLRWAVLRVYIEPAFIIIFINSYKEVALSPNHKNL
jgi:hypothetical protein